MIYRAEVFVTLKPVVNDPEGLTIRSGLHALGFDSVTDVRSGKYLALTLDEPDEAQARARVEEMARQLLANEVIEDFRIELPPERERQLFSQLSPSAARREVSQQFPSASGGGQGGGS